MKSNSVLRGGEAAAPAAAAGKAAAPAAAAARENVAGTAESGAAPGHGRRWSGRAAPKRTRRDAILQSVANVLRDSRLSSLTMQDIAAELGITKGNLYYYFRDKQDILYQCHMRCMEVSLEALHEVQEEWEARARGTTAHGCLRALLVRHMRGILDHGFGSVLLTDLDNLSPPQRKRYVARRDEFEAGVRDLIEAGVARGEFACADVKLASLSMLGAVNWIPKWYHPGGGMDSATVAEGMADFLMRALEAR